MTGANSILRFMCECGRAIDITVNAVQLHTTPAAPTPAAPTTQSEIDTARMESAKEIIKPIPDSLLRGVAESWCACAAQELANAQYFHSGRDEVLTALRRVLSSDSDDKFEMKKARKAAQAVVDKYTMPADMEKP